MHVKKLFWLLVITSSLSGCSSSPDADDIKATLAEGWGHCKGVKFQDLKKTNGVDNGKSYVMAVSFNLEVLKDLTAQEAWRSDELCPAELLNLLRAYRKSGQEGVKYAEPLKKGDLLKISDTFNMVKSEKGWIQE